DELVNEFLTQYFTKVQLGENNARIKPYMTDSAFSEEEANQNKAINQVYKD
ncbi:peptidylprolyl isomerase, partial [Streptococcus canis]